MSNSNHLISLELELLLFARCEILIRSRSLPVEIYYKVIVFTDYAFIGHPPNLIHSLIA